MALKKTKMVLRSEVAVRVAREADIRNMDVSDYLDYVMDFANLRNLDLVLKEIVVRYKSFSFTPHQLAHLYVLRAYLDSLCL